MEQERMTVIIIIAFIAFACIVIFSIWPVNYITGKREKLWWKGSVKNLFNVTKRKTKE